MRALFIAIGLVLSLVAGCGHFPYVNLREPIYLVTEDSFFVGCEKDWQGQEQCRDRRRDQVKAGISQWFRFFTKKSRPEVYIVGSTSEIPNGTINRPIRLRVQPGLCKDPDPGEAGACYRRNNFWSSPEIVFDRADQILQALVAHEFGHALGLNHYEREGKDHSVMSAGEVGDNVVLDDIERVCREHNECPLLAGAEEYKNVGFVY